MAFDKEKYWENKKNNVGSKRPKAQVIPTGDAEIAFVDNGMISKNRAFRRKKFTTNLFTRKGFIEYLGAIKITRKRHGKQFKKYVKVDKSVL